MKHLTDALNTRSASVQALREILQTGQYAPEDLSRALLYHVQDFCDGDAEAFRRTFGRLPGKHETPSGTLPEVVKLFCEFGLDPNYTEDGDSFVNYLELSDFGYSAADTVAFLLERGLNPDIRFRDGGLFEELDADITTDIPLGLADEDDLSRRLFDRKLHLWLVLIGYGAKLPSGKPPVTLCAGWDAAMLCAHREFDYAIEYTDRDPDGFVLHILHRETRKEAAYL